MRYFCFSTALLCMSGCQDVCADASNTAPSVQFGSGSTDFSPITSETILTPSWGPQGGQHIWGALQTTGLYPGIQKPLIGPDDPLLVNFSVRYEGAVFASISDSFVILEGDSELAEGYGFTLFLSELPGVFSYNYSTTQPSVPVEVSAEVEVTDSCGTTVFDKVTTLFNP